MTKLWITVAVGWLAGTALAIAQPPADPSRAAPPGQPSPFVFPGLGQPNLPPVPGQPPGPPPAPPRPGNPPAGPSQPPHFVPAVPFIAAPPPPPSSSPIVTGIITPPERGPQVWVDFDYLLWWIRNGPNPTPLLTTGSINAPILPGALNDPTTRILEGGNAFNFGTFNGGRVTAGLWLNYQQDFGLEMSGFYLGRRSSNFAAAANDNGEPLLTRPFFDVIRGTQFVSAIAVPGVQTGSFTVNATAALGGGDANFLWDLFDLNGVHLDGMVGGRFFSLSEGIQMQENTGIIQSAAGLFPLFFNGVQNVDFPNRLAISDQFMTHNQFYGGQIGLRMLWLIYPDWTLRAKAEFAAGATQQQVRIDGSTTVLDANNNVLGSARGGFLALPSNIGTLTRTRFSVLPSAEVQVGYQVLPWMHLHVGYSGLYVSSVLRPGDQINPNVNVTQAPGQRSFGTPSNAPLVPTTELQNTEFWAHGIDLGITISY